MEVLIAADQKNEALFRATSWFQGWSTPLFRWGVAFNPPATMMTTETSYFQVLPKLNNWINNDSDDLLAYEFVVLYLHSCRPEARSSPKKVSHLWFTRVLSTRLSTNDTLMNTGTYMRSHWLFNIKDAIFRSFIHARRLHARPFFSTYYRWYIRLSWHNFKAFPWLIHL